MKYVKYDKSFNRKINQNILQIINFQNDKMQLNGLRIRKKSRGRETEKQNIRG